VHIGVFCDGHLSHVAKIYGTIKSETVSKEDVEADIRCDIMGCKEYIAFTVERLER
jgi:hypothetical protein